MLFASVAVNLIIKLSFWCGILIFLQALDVSAMAIDEPSVKVEQEAVNKPADPM